MKLTASRSRGTGGGGRPGHSTAGWATWPGSGPTGGGGRRRPRTLPSRLDVLAGIGPHRRRRLLTHFGSLEKVRGAPLAELVGVLGPTLGARIFQQLHTSADDQAGRSESLAAELESR